MTITQPGPGVVVGAPLPVARQGTLLDAAQIITEASARWTGGASLLTYPAGVPDTHDPCSDGTYRSKSADNTSGEASAGAFTVVLGDSCTSRSVASDLDGFKRRLEAKFVAVETIAVERHLATIDGFSAGAYLSDENMRVISTAGVGPVEGLALLEEEIAARGNGMIHAPPGIISYWTQNGGITKTAGKFYTGQGTLVVNGAGYIGVQPYGQTAPAAGEAWAFASDFVQIRRGEIYGLDYAISQTLDRSSNTVTYYAERDYLLSWVPRQSSSDDLHIQAGVLIDRTA